MMMTDKTQDAQLPPCPLTGAWRYSNGYLMCGTLRIFRTDFDTDPSPEFKDELMSWVVAGLNEARSSVGGQAQEYLRGVDACVAAFQKAATEFQLEKHGGSVDEHYKDNEFRCTAVLDDFEVFATIRMAQLAASTAKVEDEKCANHCGHDPALMKGDPAYISEGKPWCMYNDEDGYCGHVCPALQPTQPRAIWNEAIRVAKEAQTTVTGGYYMRRAIVAALEAARDVAPQTNGGQQ